MSTTPRVPTTPATSRLATSQNVQPSPHYATTRRHSLYGVEDRVILDPGSRIWKVGFSGEGKPRDVFYPGGANGPPLWKLNRASNPLDRHEEEKMLEMKLQACLRSAFHDSLLADPKARKVIIIEHPLLPLYIKEMIARVLFENQVPSVSFASSHLLSLFAVGRITGLVVDCGHLESVGLPIFASRPMFPQIQTTPIAGDRLTSHIRALLLLFASYIPPPNSLSTSASAVLAVHPVRVPEEILTDSVIEDIKTRCCFVGESFDASQSRVQAAVDARDSSDADVPPSSDFPIPESDASETESDRAQSASPKQVDAIAADESHLQAVSALYKNHSTASDIQMRVMPPPTHTNSGRGTLIIPGWIRERAAEVLFEGGDVDESSLAELILDTLLKVPRDLRKTMASSILVTGGTAMMPGFIPRLHSEILRRISERLTSRQVSTTDRPPLPPYDKYKSLRPLIPYFSILNNPSPPTPKSERAGANGGKAPAFSPAALAWVGGSLAGALKIGGIEVARESWDEQYSGLSLDDGMDASLDIGTPFHLSIIPDWTRSPLPVGAPQANSHT